jgi:hypothetical protein
MPVGQPADDKLEDWYEAAALCNENRITNAAFFSAKPVPTRHTSGRHRCFRLPHHELHLCRHHHHLYPVSQLRSQWMLMQFGGGQLTRKPVTGADNQVTLVVTAHFITTPAT